MCILWPNMNLEWILPSCFVSEYRKKRYFKFMTKHEFKIFLSIMSCFRIPQKKTFWIYVLWQSMNLNSVFSSWAILEYQKILLASWTCGRLENEFRSFNAENLGSIGGYKITCHQSLHLETVWPLWRQSLQEPSAQIREYPGSNHLKVWWPVTL